MTRRNAVARKAHEVVAHQLRQRIVNGELAAGDRLPPEDELTVQFGIARTTLREALRVLESQGLIAIRRGRGGGPVVTHPDLAPAATALAVSLQLQRTTVGDLDAARRLIEPQIARQLAITHSADDIAALVVAVDDAAAAAERDDADDFGIRAAAVHETLMERSGNNTMSIISKLLHEMVQAYYSQGIANTDQRAMRRAVRSYRKLIVLIEAGDADAAAAHWEAQMSFTIGGHNPASLVTVSAGL